MGDSAVLGIEQAYDVVAKRYPDLNLLFLEEETNKVAVCKEGDQDDQPHNVALTPPLLTMQSDPAPVAVENPSVQPLPMQQLSPPLIEP